MTHEIQLNRKWYTKLTTIGELAIDGKSFCFILEDVCRDLNRDGDLNDPGEQKVHGKTCIPAGRYQVIIDYSNRYQKQMPHVLNVPGYAGIRIHPGNYAGDTEGCLLPGSFRSTDFVGNSRETFSRFLVKLQALLATGKVFITIKDLPLIK